MSKLKAQLDQAVANDLGVELSSESTTLLEVAGNPDCIKALVFAFVLGNDFYYDLLPVWRIVNGMRIKLPKFQSRPVIEDRLSKQQYKRYYALGNGILTPLKVSKVKDLKNHLPFRIGDDPSYQTTLITHDETMGIRKKPLLFHRWRPSYAPPRAVEETSKRLVGA